jgi:hypothetical protein
MQTQQDLLQQPFPIPDLLDVAPGSLRRTTMSLVEKATRNV